MIALITTALQIVLILLQQLLKLVANYQQWSAEQKALAQKRMSDTLASFKVLIANAGDNLNEDMWLKAASDEQLGRYAKYMPLTLAALQAGKGYYELAAIVEWGMHDRVLRLKDKIISILNLTLSPYEKAQLIASELASI